MLSPESVRDALQEIIDYWSDYWGIPSSRIPDPHPKTSQTAKILRRVSTRRRTIQIESTYGVDPFPTSSGVFPEDFGADPEARLLAAMIIRALVDFSRLSFSAFHWEQKVALSSYWWIMDLPFPLPADLSEEEEREFRNGERDFFMLEPGDRFWDHCNVSFPQAVDCTNRLKDFFPWESCAEINDLYRQVAFSSCCSIIGVDVETLRARASLIPPLWSGVSDG